MKLTDDEVEAPAREVFPVREDGTSQLSFLEGFRRGAEPAREMFDYSETLFRAAISAQNPIDA